MIFEGECRECGEDLQQIENVESDADAACVDPSCATGHVRAGDGEWLTVREAFQRGVRRLSDKDSSKDPEKRGERR